MKTLLLLSLGMVVVLALTVFLILACGIDRIKPMPKPPKPSKPSQPKRESRGDRMCRQRQARTRLGELLRSSHPEWN